MTATERRQLFERLGYPVAFLRHASTCLSELTLADAARQEGNLAAALAESRARDALDAEYNEGKWARWFARDLKYPYTGLSREIEETLRGFDVDDKGKTKAQ